MLYSSLITFLGIRIASFLFTTVAPGPRTVSGTRRHWQYIDDLTEFELSLLWLFYFLSNLISLFPKSAFFLATDTKSQQTKAPSQMMEHLEIQSQWGDTMWWKQGHVITMKFDGIPVLKLLFSRWILRPNNDLGWWFPILVEFPEKIY